MKLFLYFVLSISVLSCSRSQKYQEDQQYYQPEQPTGYYQGSHPTVTDRIQNIAQPKKRIVIFNFWNDTPASYKGLGEFAADELRRGLFLTEKVIIPTDAQLSLETKDFVQGDQVKVAQLVREGRRMGVAVVIIGRISKVIFRQKGDDVGLLRKKESLAGADIEIKAFDIAGGREIMAIGKSGFTASNAIVALESENLESPEYRGELAKFAVRDATRYLVPEILKQVEKMSWEGRVAKIEGKKVYINAGRASGLVGGDILKVQTPGDDLYDPVTGAYLGRTGGQLKGTLEITEFVGQDGAAGVLHTGGNFQEGDIVRLY